MPEIPPGVFLSVGSKEKRTSDQDQFVQALEGLLGNSGFQVRTAAASSINPLAKIREEMNLCDGAVIVAFERIYAKEGRERKSSRSSEKLADLKLTTVWNQVEAAMAYCLGLPLLIVREKGLRAEGLLQQYDWCIHETVLSGETTRGEHFLGTFKDWADRVRAQHRTKSASARVRAGDQSKDLLTVDMPKLFAFIGTIAALLFGAFWAGSKWPGLAEVIKAMTTQ
jgi:hypothetical protein